MKPNDTNDYAAVERYQIRDIKFCVNQEMSGKSDAPLNVGRDKPEIMGQ